MKFDFKWFTTLPGIFITVGVVLLIIALIILIVTGKKSKKEKKNIEESGGALQSTPQDVNAQVAPVANPSAVPATDMSTLNAMPVSNVPTFDQNMNVGPTPIEPVPVENVPASPMVNTMIDSNVGSVAPAVSEVTPTMPTVDSNIVSQSANDIPIPAMPVPGALNEQNSASTSFSPVDAIPTNVSSVNNDPFVNTQEPVVTGLEQVPQAITPEPIVQNVITPEPVVNSVPNVVQEPVANLEPVVAPVNPINNASMVSPQINSVNSAPVISNPTVAPATQNVSVAPVAPVAPVTPVVENNPQSGPVIYGGVNPTANLSDVNLNGNQSHQIYGGADPLENTQPIPGVQTVQPVQPVQPVMTAPEMMPNPVQQ